MHPGPSLDPMLRQLLRLATAGLLAVTVSCSESSTAPRNSRGALFDRNSVPVRTTGEFTITPAGGTIDLGVASLNFPKNAVCDPDAPGYDYSSGACPKTLGRAIRVHVVIQSNPDGTYTLDFDTPLLFRTDAFVSLSTPLFRNFIKANTASWRYIDFFYSASLNAAPVDDALSDLSVATLVDQATGIVFRRIKHFS